MVYQLIKQITGYSNTDDRYKIQCPLYEKWMKIAGLLTSDEYRLLVFDSTLIVFMMLKNYGFKCQSIYSQKNIKIFGPEKSLKSLFKNFITTCMGLHVFKNFYNLIQILQLLTLNTPNMFKHNISASFCRDFTQLKPSHPL